MKLRTATLCAPLIALVALSACSTIENEGAPSVLQRCQDHVSNFAKYPGTAQWVQVNNDTEENGKHYIAGEADFNNDAGNPVRANYHCILDTESDEWVDRPSLEPRNPTTGRFQTERWGGASSPMLEKYGDQMSLESGS